MKVVKLLLAFISMCIGTIILAAGYLVSTAVTILIYFLWDVWVNLAGVIKENTEGFITSINKNKLSKKK